VAALLAPTLAAADSMAVVAVVAVAAAVAAGKHLPRKHNQG
jgi:hypothetical protein